MVLKHFNNILKEKFKQFAKIQAIRLGNKKVLKICLECFLMIFHFLKNKIISWSFINLTLQK